MRRAHHRDRWRLPLRVRPPPYGVGPSIPPPLIEDLWDDESYSCDACPNATFPRFNQLLVHLEAAHARTSGVETAEEDSSCCCPHCPRTFAVPKWLSAHLKYHHLAEQAEAKTQAPSECQECGAKVPKEESEKHAALFCPKRKLQCSDCPVKCRSVLEYIAHRKRCHTRRKRVLPISV